MHNVDMEIVMYSRETELDSAALGHYLTAIGVDFRTRQVDHDPAAKSEWERLDGRVTPVLVIDRTSIVHGLERTRVDQLLGLVGC